MSIDNEWIEAGEVGCRLLLHLPAKVVGRLAPSLLDELLALEAVAGLVVEPWATPARQLSGIAARATAQARACLLVDAIETVRAVGAHGCHLSAWQKVRAARSTLPAGWILGASCGKSRHAAMVAGEDGVDYVLFGALGQAASDPERQSELVAWWAELFYLPVAVALGSEPAGFERYVAAGADFLVLTLDVDGERSSCWSAIRELAAQLLAMASARTGES